MKLARQIPVLLAAAIAASAGRRAGTGPIYPGVVVPCRPLRGWRLRVFRRRDRLFFAGQCAPAVSTASS